MKLSILLLSLLLAGCKAAPKVQDGTLEELYFEEIPPYQGGK